MRCLLLVGLGDGVRDGIDIEVVVGRGNSSAARMWR